MTDPILTLADQSWPVAPFVLGEQKTIVPLIYSAQAEVRANGITTRYYDLLIDLMLAVAKRSDPATDRDHLEALTTSLADLQTGFLLICKQAGMVMGEAKAP